MNISRPLLLTAILTISFATPSYSEQQGTPKRLLVANTSKWAIIAPDDSIEREMKVGGLHDASLLPNGNILCQNGWTKTQEISPDGKVVWEYDSATANGNVGTKVEVHAIQRLPNGNTLIAESGPKRLIEVDAQGAIQHIITLTVEKPNPHRDTRLVRKTISGTYLVAHEGDGKVREYDQSGKVIWDFEIPLTKPIANGHGPEAYGNAVYSAVRLENGNTLIGTGNGHTVLEVTPYKNIVWKIEQDDLPNIKLAWVTFVERLPNGNTLIGNCHAGPNMPLSIEVTPKKEVVWTLNDFQRFGNSTVLVVPLPQKQ